MPFIYKPSLWGFTAAAIFIALAIIEVQSTGRNWVEVLMWGLLGFSFAVKYLPKFLIFSLPGAMASFIALVAGGAMFLMYAADRIG